MANQTVTNVPWERSKPFLIDGMKELQQGYNEAAANVGNVYSGNTVAGTSPLIDASRAAATDYLANGAADAWVNAQTQTASDLMSGGYYQPVQEQWRAAQLTPAQMASVNAQGASAGQVGVNYRPAADRILSGQVDNPYLRNYVQGMLQQTSQEFGEGTMANLRGGGIGAGQRSSSRQGIAEGLAASRFGQDLNRTASQFYSNAYDQAQGRASDMALGLSGQDTQRAIATAGNQTQASVASANNRLSGLLGNQRTAMDAQQMALDAQRSNQSAAIDSGKLSLGALGLAEGVGRQRLDNYESLGRIGDSMRADEQRLLDAARQEWEASQRGTFDLAKEYYGALSGNASGAGTSTTSGADGGGGALLGALGGASAGVGLVGGLSSAGMLSAAAASGPIGWGIAGLGALAGGLDW